jgi:monoamine oxidase
VDAEVLVIGAGVAGLAVARGLREAGRNVIVLEARDRIGGRIFTLRDAHAPLPLELGAEFVHGAAPHTRQRVDEAGIVLYAVEGDHWQSQNRGLRNMPDAWQRIGRVLGRLDEKRRPDRSFLDFLNTKPGGKRWAEDRALALSFVRGFHAADPARISERALEQAGDPTDSDQAQQHRVLEGYDQLVDSLAADLHDVIRLRQVVQQIHWEPASVQVTASTRAYHAHAVVITVPIGVLQVSPPEYGALQFVPELPASHQKAIHSLDSGCVIHLTLLFKERIWETAPASRLPKQQRLDRLAFLYPKNSVFSVFWTMHPLLVPVMVAWAGGPPAAELSRNGHAAVEEHALADLSQHLGITRKRLEASLEATFLHDWLTDPFSRCAYSYAAVGGAQAGRRLAQPIANTLFFSGEATAEESGTVEGALSSAERVVTALFSLFGGS